MYKIFIYWYGGDSRFFTILQDREYNNYTEADRVGIEIRSHLRVQMRALSMRYFITYYVIDAEDEGLQVDQWITHGYQLIANNNSSCNITNESITGYQLISNNRARDV